MSPRAFRRHLHLEDVTIGRHTAACTQWSGHPSSEAGRMTALLLSPTVIHALSVMWLPSCQCSGWRESAMMKAGPRWSLRCSNRCSISTQRQAKSGAVRGEGRQTGKPPCRSARTTAPVCTLTEYGNDSEKVAMTVLRCCYHARCTTRGHIFEHW